MGDPFHGNEFLNLSYHRDSDYTVDVEGMGVFHTTGKMWRKMIEDVEVSSDFCTKWYGNYFKLDDDLQDFRIENEEIKTFGYCGRDWVTALLIFEGVLVIVVMFQLVVAVLALILSARKEVDTVELHAIPA
eukprot:NODE_1913_length_565_cov_1511.860465_g1446_i0.p1 GENE.NODE_1913_length_565_cov_1511.860465_g1446_i0~~NODE_1913_length_565_cov_1511.860465_g1446_i0.p1  ORF type:complete len:140 (-),score=41.38 NODE_1913_length_565_cov_1511.860465_g1446_i0:145-537(-)